MTIVRDYNGRKIELEMVIPFMDPEITEMLHSEGIEDQQQFFERYADEHAKKFDGEEFAAYYGRPWYYLKP